MIGQRARILGIDKCDKRYRHKLLSMGLVCGTEITLLRIAPLGDPIEILVRGAAICLRKDEARHLRLELCNNEK